MILHYNDTQLPIDVNDSSYRYRAIKGEHALTLYFSLPGHIEIPVGAWCEFEKEIYTLEKPEDFKMHNTRNFEYTLVMEASQAKLKRYKFCNPVDRRLKFNLTAKPKEHLQMLVDNLNKRESGWRMGECVTAVDKCISYNHTSCDAALSQIADAFETEWEIEGQTIHLHKVEYNKENPLCRAEEGENKPLSYGRGNGFKPGVGRTNFDDSKAVEILYVQGGDKNIDASTYNKDPEDPKKPGSSVLLLPRNATLEYEGRTYISDADGYSMRRKDVPLNSQVEDSLDCSEIYPSWVGTVSKVEVTKEGFCDFLDKTIPDGLDFSKPDSRFKGETMTVIFQSGQLAGKEFEIQQNDNVVYGYVHAERRFKVVEQTIDGVPMPKGAFMPVVGDTYSVFGILLPQAYIDDPEVGAEWKLFRAGAKYMYENEGQRFTFTGELDGIWAKKDWDNIGGKIRLGGYVLFGDSQFEPEGVGIRIVGIKDYINNPHSPEIELSNQVVGSSIMSDLRKIESNEVLNDSQRKEALQFTKRRFRDAQETTKMLEGALLNFSKAENPIAVNTMQLLVGDPSLQFIFTSSTSDPDKHTLSPTFKYDKESAGKFKVTFPAGNIVYLQHKTLGIDTGIFSSTYDYRIWKIGSWESPPLTNPEAKYYLYAKVSKTPSEAVQGFYVSESDPIGLDSDPDYYHLLCGIINSEYEGDRSFVSLYGFAELTPGRLTIPRIVSPNGKTFFDVERGEIGGKITFISGSSGLDNLDEWADKQAQIDAAQAAADDANEVIEQMNSDGVFDQVEKQSMRTAWENVNGVSDLAVEGTSGSYYTTLKSVAGGGDVQAFTLLGNEQFMVQKQ